MDTKVFLPDALVLGPGGMKGYTILGSLLLLEEKGCLKKIRHVVGCSIGSLIGLLWIIGYSVKEIFEEALRMDIFKDIAHFSLSQTTDYVGIFSNDAPKDFLTRLVKGKCGGVIPTLDGIYKMFGIELETVSVNLSKGITVYFNKIEHPKLSCVDAVLLSINIPLLFYKITYDGDLYVDGGIGDPYPIKRVDDGKRIVLGFYIKEVKNIDHNAIDYIYFIFQYPIDELYQIKKKQASDKVIHLLLECETIDMTGITYSPRDISKMFVCGYCRASKLVEIYRS